jgi:hypothetical protein
MSSNPQRAGSGSGGGDIDLSGVTWKSNTSGHGSRHGLTGLPLDLVQTNSPVSRSRASVEYLTRAPQRLHAPQVSNLPNFGFSPCNQVAPGDMKVERQSMIDAEQRNQIAISDA